MSDELKLDIIRYKGTVMIKLLNLPKIIDNTNSLFPIGIVDSSHNKLSVYDSVLEIPVREYEGDWYKAEHCGYDNIDDAIRWIHDLMEAVDFINHKLRGEL